MEKINEPIEKIKITGVPTMVKCRFCKKTFTRKTRRNIFCSKLCCGNQFRKNNPDKNYNKTKPIPNPERLRDFFSVKKNIANNQIILFFKKKSLSKINMTPPQFLNLKFHKGGDF